MPDRSDFTPYHQELDLMFERMEQKVRDHQATITALELAQELAKRGVKVEALDSSRKQLEKLGRTGGMTKSVAAAFAEEVISRTIELILAREPKA